MRTVALAVTGLVTMTLPDAAHADGKLGLLPTGTYKCALPGNAAGKAWIDQPANDFTIRSGSRYSSAKGSGTYLMEGKRVVFTRGPMRGTAMMRISSGLLQVVGEEGKLGRLRCQRIRTARD